MEVINKKKKRATLRQTCLTDRHLHESVQISPVSLQEKICRFELNGETCFIMQVNKIFCIGPYLLLYGWHSDHADYHVYYGKKLCQCDIIEIQRDDVNTYLGLDDNQKKGFILVARCGSEKSGEIILQVHHTSFGRAKYFSLTQDTLPEDITAIPKTLGAAFESLRQDMTRFPDDWREALERHPELRLWGIADEQLPVAAPDPVADDWVAFIDEYHQGHVLGWAKRKDSDASQCIDVYINGVCVASRVNADIFRKDLQQEGIGHGLYGFDCTGNVDPHVVEGTVQVAIHEAGGCVIARRTFEIQVVDTYKLFIDALDNDTIRGWCVNEAKNWEILELELYVDGLFFKTLTTDRSRGDLKSKNISAGRGGFLSENPLAYMRPGNYSVSVALPDGSLTKERIAATEGRPVPAIIDIAFLQRPVTIIIPVYNAAKDLEICLEKLLQHTYTTAEILLIDDCSPDLAVASVLSRHAGNEQIRILRNERNLGFSGTVNRGIAEAGENDVILLNSDARVTPGWLQGILRAAIVAPKIATVTPMSDRAGAFSAPETGNANMLPDGVTEDAFARAFRRHSLGVYPRVPTGNGFCMFISRACIKAKGVLDEEAFPRGYGEENDFCMRTWREGWQHIIDDRTYVFHERGQSFGTAKEELITQGRAVLDARYPEYKSAISVFSTDEKLLAARHSARRAWRECAEKTQPRTRILFVVSTRTGGTPQTNGDLMSAMPDTVECFVLWCDAKQLTVARMEDGKEHVLYSHTLEEPVNPLSHRSAEYDAVVAGWLFDLDIDLVHIRHLAWHSLSLPRVAHELGKKVVFSFHDFYTLTPTVNMLDDLGVFDGSTFLDQADHERVPLWPDAKLPVPTGSWLVHWRERFSQALRFCDAFVTTSESARERILKGLPGLSADNFFVIPHGRDFTAFSRLRQRPEHGKALKLLVPGNINRAKGLETIFALAEHDKAGLLEFHVLGKMQPTERDIPRQIIRHGAYTREDFAKKAAAVKPHAGLIFSIWDETYCHTLTELWSVGLPAFVFDFPTVAGRVRKSGAGWVVDHHDIEKLYSDILRLAFSVEEQNRTDAAIANWQSGYGAANTTRLMGARYYELYARLIRNDKISVNNTPSFPKIAVVCPCGNTLRRAYASTYIRIWERTRTVCNRNIAYIRMTPQSLLGSIREGLIDGAIIQRTAIPLTMAQEILQAFAKTGIFFALDLDDDLLDIPESHDPTGTYGCYKNTLRQLMEAAAVLTVSTPNLEKLYGEINPNIRLLPNKLSERLWAPSPPERKQEEIVRALYMGTQSHNDDLEMILPALDTVADQIPYFRLSLIGITVTEHMTPERERWLEIIPISDETKDYDQFVPWLRKISDKFDFALAPLQETPFNQNKSYLKLLDYAALGLPVIASDIEVYRSALSPGTLLVGNTPEQWSNALLMKIEQNKKNVPVREKQRQWLCKNHMLNTDIQDFDIMIIDTINKS